MGADTATIPSLRQAPDVMGNNMTTLRYLISSLLTISFFACSHESKSKLTILFNRVDKLEKGSEVYLKSLPIGEVTQLELFGDSVLVDVKIADTIKIPFDSRCIINPSLLGSSHITIEPSDNSIYLTKKDTLRGSYLEKDIFDYMVSDSAKQEKIQKSIEKIGEGIKEIIEVSTDSTKKRK